MMIDAHCAMHFTAPRLAAGRGGGQGTACRRLCWPWLPAV
jgi:hypothetical protein